MYQYRGFECIAAWFFGLIAVWAAVSRRHWFVRLAGAAAPLLAALAISAFEVVLFYGVQMLLVTAAVRLRNRTRGYRPQFSLETVLLSIVVVAVVAAVAAKIPPWSWDQWVVYISGGLVAGYGTALSLWLVGGQWRFRYRLAMFLAGFAVLVAGIHARDAFIYGAGSGWRASYWWSLLGSYYDPGYVVEWLAWVLPGVTFTVTVMVVAIALGRASGWFSHGVSPNRRPGTYVKWLQRAAGAGVCVIFLAAAAPLIYLFGRLQTPTPLPRQALPSPNGYDTFVAAGKAAPADFRFIDEYKRIEAIAPEDAPEALARLTPVVELVDKGLRQSCRIPNPLVVLDEDSNEYDHVFRASSVLSVHQVYLRHFGKTSDYAAAILRNLRFEQESARGGGLFLLSAGVESLGLCHLHGVIRELNDDECRILAAALIQIANCREPYHERRAMQRIIDEHDSWTSHAQLLITEWADEDPYADELAQDRLTVAMFRLLTVDLALQAFTLVHGRPPVDLKELSPEYLAELPIDPYDDRPLRYRAAGAMYRLYSIGPDQKDDGGRGSYDASGDIVLIGPHTQPYWRRLAPVIRGAAERFVAHCLTQLEPQ